MVRAAPREPVSVHLKAEGDEERHAGLASLARPLADIGVEAALDDPVEGVLGLGIILAVGWAPRGPEDERHRSGTADGGDLRVREAILAPEAREGDDRLMPPRKLLEGGDGGRGQVVLGLAEVHVGANIGTAWGDNETLGGDDQDRCEEKDQERKARHTEGGSTWTVAVRGTFPQETRAPRRARWKAPHTTMQRRGR